MTPQQAELILRQEVASGSQTGKALLVLLEHLELEAYRVSAKTSDPYHTVRICGRGEGIHHVLTKVTPAQEAAPQGLLASPAGEPK